LETHIPNPQAPPAAHGTQKVPGYDPEVQYQAIQKAFDTAVINELQVQMMRILRPLTVMEMDALNDFCIAKEGISLADKIENKISGDFGKRSVR
jgi:annexin A7/11